jgi:hypothetical protein
MTNYTATIDSFVIGDDLTIERTITVPSGVTIANAWFTVKTGYDLADSNAFILKKITTNDVVGSGYISDTGADGTGKVAFYLTPIDTLKLTPYSEYPYDIQIIWSDNKKRTIELGVIVAYPQVTKE